MPRFWTRFRGGNVDPGRLPLAVAMGQELGSSSASESRAVGRVPRGFGRSDAVPLGFGWSDARPSAPHWATSWTLQGGFGELWVVPWCGTASKGRLRTYTETGE